MASSVAFAAGDYTYNVPYQQAVPNFIDTLMEGSAQVKDEQEFQNISVWEQDLRPRLPEFLNDLLIIAQSLEAQQLGSADDIFAQYTAFSDKWVQIVNTYPDLAELDPVLEPIISKLFEGLPTLKPPSSDNPMSGFVDWYKAMEAVNPWGVGDFFQIPVLPNEEKIKTVKESLREVTVFGMTDIKILHREARVTRNGITVFYELIQDDQVINRFVEFRDPSFLHEALEQMKANGEDPVIIQGLQGIIDLLDYHLQLALQNGVLDECSYAYIYRKQLSSQMNGCTDIVGLPRDYQKMLQYDPEDHIDQVTLGNPHPDDFWLNNQFANSEVSSAALEKQHMEQISSSILNQYAETIPLIPQNAINLILIPGAAMSALGLFKLF